MNPISKFLMSPVTGNIAVVGDVMIDDYYQVRVDRISPEFPIPVMASSCNKPYLSLPGGAANVVRQLEGCGIGAFLYGFANTRSREVFLCCNGVNERGLLVHNDVPQVPVKQRFYQEDFPICRWDLEDKAYGMGHDLAGLDEIRFSLLRDWDAMKPKVTILSDYDKGFFTDSARAILLSGKNTTIVDPKKGRPSIWKGCTIFKPNRKEANEMTGKLWWEDQAKVLQSETDARAVVITEGSEGVVGIIDGKFFAYTPKRQIKATSVIGAGDCFVAFLAAAIAKDMDYLEAVEVAFEASSLYVRKRHNEPVTDKELLSELDPYLSMMPPRNYTLAFTNGCFDILHQGHVELLKYAKSTADKLVVAINSDESVRRLKGNGRPINSLDSRMKMLLALKCVDYVVAFDDDTPIRLIQEFKPDTLIKGGDYTEDQVVGRESAGKVLIFPTVPGYSTTLLIDKLGNAAGASAGTATAFA